MQLVQILSAAGIGGVIGSLLTTLLREWFAQKSYVASRAFQERKEAYLGMLEALYRSEIERTEETARRVGHWRNRCELVASPRVRELVARLFETNPIGDAIHPDRPAVLEELRSAMRKDLGVQA